MRIAGSFGIYSITHTRAASFLSKCVPNETQTAHEYIKVGDDGVGTCGITDFAQAALGDIVFVDLPAVGDEFEKGDAFGSVESVKAASDIYAPVGGAVLESNEDLTDKPELVNSDAEGTAWFVKLKIKNKTELDGLMDAKSYKDFCDKEAH
jgi:glycine cleavage system H protein